MNDITKATRRASYLRRPSLRALDILDVLDDNRMTSRQIAYELGYADLNAVKPRLTELKDAGLVEAVAKTRDEMTGRSVAVWKRV